MFLSYICGSSLAEYCGTGADRDEKFLNVIFVKENISCTSKIELPYYSVDFSPKICIYCGMTGTSRTLGSSVEFYPKCLSCKDNTDILRRKRKTTIVGDFSRKQSKST